MAEYHVIPCPGCGSLPCCCPPDPESDTQDREPAQAAPPKDLIQVCRHGKRIGYDCGLCELQGADRAAPPSAAPTLDDEAIWDRVDDGTLMIEQDANESDMVQVSMSKVVHDRIIAALRAAAPSSSGERGAFWLERVVDASGVSGTGRVAQGFQFADGTCALRWLTTYRSTAVYASLDDVERIHGHNGSTRIVRAAPSSGEPREMAWCVNCGADPDVRVTGIATPSSAAAEPPRCAEQAENHGVMRRCVEPLDHTGPHRFKGSAGEFTEPHYARAAEPVDVALLEWLEQWALIDYGPDGGITAGQHPHLPEPSRTVPANEQRLRDALTQAAHWFDEYVLLYGAKGDDHRKMLNLSRARACRAAIDVPSPPAERTEP